MTTQQLTTQQMGAERSVLQTMTVVHSLAMFKHTLGSMNYNIRAARNTLLYLCTTCEQHFKVVACQNKANFDSTLVSNQVVICLSRRRVLSY